MIQKIFFGMLLFIPLTFILELMHGNQNLVFLVALLAIIPLAKFMGDSTEAIAARTTPRLGGFLNATFGNATEMILSVVALLSGYTELVKASIVGSVVSNLLLVLGLSMLTGGLKFKNQHFSRKGIDFSVTLLVLSILCVLLPTGFLNSMNVETVTSPFLALSEVVAVIMLLVYVAGLYFSFYTHQDIFGTEHKEVAESEGPVAPLGRSVAVLASCTVLVALLSEVLVKSVEGVSQSMGLSEFFIGLIIIPIIGNAAEHSSAVMMAIKNKLDVSIEIAVGSSTQIILLVFPIMILVGWATGHPMSVIFNRYELVALIAAVVVVSKVVSDGESNWFEGLLLCLVYGMLAVATLIVA